jgi:hypothetical protein
MDELVKRLREPCQYENCILCQQAADALEERQKKLAFEEQNAKAFLHTAHKLLDELPCWIPVSERLPEYGATVLVYGSKGGIYTARYERARTEWGRDSWWKLNSKSHICNPTHWMPLPEPPKEE